MVCEAGMMMGSDGKGSVKEGKVRKGCYVAGK